MSLFILFYCRTTKISEMRRPWPKNSPPLFSTATLIPNTNQIYKWTYFAWQSQWCIAFREKCKLQMFLDARQYTKQTKNMVPTSTAANSLSAISFSFNYTPIWLHFAMAGLNDPVFKKGASCDHFLTATILPILPFTDNDTHLHSFHCFKLFFVYNVEKEDSKQKYCTCEGLGNICWG